MQSEWLHPWCFFGCCREVVGATVGSLGAVLGVILIAAREVLLRLGAVLLGCCFGCFFGCCQGCVKVARNLEGRTLTMNVKMRLLFLVCCKCVLKSNMIFGAYSGVFSCNIS